MSRKRNVESEGGVVFIDPKMKALSSLDGEIGWLAAFPYGLQHVLAMFVANLAPIAIIAAAAGLPEDLRATLIQNAMFIAGIGTFVQLFPLWRVGSGLPIVMGISFTFVSVACTIAATQGYGALVGAVIVGGLIEGLLGLFARWWRRIITPIVAAVVVTSIGFSLLGVGAASFGGGSGAEGFGSATNLILGTVSLLACLVFQGLAKGATKQLSVLFGLVVGYLVAIPLGKVDFSGFASAQLFSLPGVLPVTPEFNLGAIITVTLIFLVSATETVGDCSALTAAALRRNPTDKELSGAVTADGLVSSLAGVFGCSPVTSFSQNVGLIAMTGVVNRRAIATGAVVLVLAGFVPVVSLVFASLPEAVLGGCTNDVRQHHRQRLPDDRQCRLLPAQHHHRRAVAGRRHRVYADGRHLRYLPGARAERLCRQLRGRGLRRGHSGELAFAQRSEGGGPADRGGGQRFGGYRHRRVRILDPWKPSRT